MRVVSLLLLVFLAVPAFAQEPVIKDTTSAWRYAPIQVGTVREYDQFFIQAGGTQYFRTVSARDSMIEGTAYVVEERYVATEPFAEWTYSGYRLVRFDTLSANLLYRWPDGNEQAATLCPFDGDFGEVVYCPKTDPTPFEVRGGYEQTVEIGGEQVDVQAVKYHYFHEIIIEWNYPVYAADIGLVRIVVDKNPHDRHELVYARIPGADGSFMEYGTPAPVANETGQVPSATFSLAAYPNPFTEAVTLRLAIPSPQRVTLGVYDALGRRIYAEERVTSGTEVVRLDTANWAPGLYVVRLGTAGGTVTTSVVKR